MLSQGQLQVEKEEGKVALDPAEVLGSYWEGDNYLQDPLLEVAKAGQGYEAVLGSG